MGLTTIRYTRAWINENLHRRVVLPFSEHRLDMSTRPTNLWSFLFTLTSHVLGIPNQRAPPSGPSAGVDDRSDELSAAQFDKLSISLRLSSCHQDSEQDTTHKQGPHHVGEGTVLVHSRLDGWGDAETEVPWYFILFFSESHWLGEEFAHGFSIMFKWAWEGQQFSVMCRVIFGYPGQHRSYSR